MYADVEKRLKKKNKMLFSRDSKCLQELLRLIELQKHRTLVMWALECAQIPLEQIEKTYLDEHRPRRALELCEAWAKGEIKMPPAKQAILDAHTAAKEVNNDVFAALCHAVGHAGATVHVETHAIGLPIYELTAIVLTNGDYQALVGEKVQYYCERLLFWQENIDAQPRKWASFLADDTRPNKEKLLSDKNKMELS